MDDNEYYAAMRRQYKPKATTSPKKKEARQTAAFTSLCLKQGREDAEMLAEKKEQPMPTPKKANPN